MMLTGLKDDVLLQAVVKTEKEVKRMKEDVDAKKWRMVADQMKAMKVSRPGVLWSYLVSAVADNGPAGCQLLPECLSRSLRGSPDGYR
jgi:hypothetical protein